MVKKHKINSLARDRAPNWFSCRGERHGQPTHKPSPESRLPMYWPDGPILLAAVVCAIRPGPTSGTCEWPARAHRNANICSEAVLILGRRIAYTRLRALNLGNHLFHAKCANCTEKGGTILGVNGCGSTKWECVGFRWVFSPSVKSPSKKMQY